MYYKRDFRFDYAFNLRWVSFETLQNIMNRIVVLDFMSSTDRRFMRDYFYSLLQTNEFIEGERFPNELAMTSLNYAPLSIFTRYMLMALATPNKGDVEIQKSGLKQYEVAVEMYQSLLSHEDTFLDRNTFEKIFKLQQQ